MDDFFQISDVHIQIHLTKKRQQTDPNGPIVNVRSLGPERKEALDVRLDTLEEARMKLLMVVLVPGTRNRYIIC